MSRNPSSQVQVPVQARPAIDKSYKYKVKFINPKKKCDFILLTWHQVSSWFETVSELKLKLKDDFPGFVPNSTEFHVGYMENRTTQQWVFAREDLVAMYNVWCWQRDYSMVWQKIDSDQEQPPRKRKSTSTLSEGATQKQKKVMNCWKSWANLMKNI